MMVPGSKSSAPGDNAILPLLILAVVLTIGFLAGVPI